ncbi:STAS domain-containing protein [Streptomyces microflavus]|uniref:STAS domain-containing protein n=1 Tax=Streptomyces microflavus TaxID=1919 RepID=UPI003424CAB3
MLLQLGARLHAVVLDMGHVPFMSIGGLRLLDRLLSYGAKSGVHVVMIGWQPAAAAARGAVFAHRPLRATGGGLPRRRGPEPDPRNPGPLCVHWSRGVSFDGGDGCQGPNRQCSIRAAEADISDVLPGIRLPDLLELRARGVVGSRLPGTAGTCRVLGAGVVDEAPPA